MLETRDLILDKAKLSDWEEMYRNVWSRPETARYTLWRISESEADARERIEMTIAFQKWHDTYFVYEKASGEPIGFAGVEEVAPRVYGETGICLGPDFAGRGFGKQILRCLMDYCKNEFAAKEFVYFTREDNEVSRRLAESMGFRKIEVEQRADGEDGSCHTWIKYSKAL